MHKEVKPLDLEKNRSNRCSLFLGFKAPFLYRSRSGSWTCHWCRVSSLGLVVVCRVMLSPAGDGTAFSVVNDGMMWAEIHGNHPKMILFSLISGLNQVGEVRPLKAIYQNLLQFLGRLPLISNDGLQWLPDSHSCISSLFATIQAKICARTCGNFTTCAIHELICKMREYSQNSNDNFKI